MHACTEEVSTKIRDEKERDLYFYFYINKLVSNKFKNERAIHHVCSSSSQRL